MIFLGKAYTFNLQAFSKKKKFKPYFNLIFICQEQMVKKHLITKKRVKREEIAENSNKKFVINFSFLSAVRI